MIHIGNTADGEKVEIPIFHTGIFGRSGSGKTFLLKYMLSQVVKQGYKVLIFDSKVVGAEFDGIGVDIPFFLEESTDPDVYKSLIEGMRTKGRGNMDRYRGAFIELCDPADGTPAHSFQEIGERLDGKMHDKAIRGNTRMMYSEIRHDHSGRNGLMALLGRFKFSSKLQLPAAICRMPTHRLPNLALQGLVVRSTLDALLADQSLSKIIVLIDEVPNLAHQRKYNPAKESIQLLDSQGRSKKKWGWYSGQNLTGFDKGSMKNLGIWAMSGQMEKNEVREVELLQTDKILTRDAIKKLKRQQFIIVTEDWTKLVKVPDIYPKTLFGTTKWTVDPAFAKEVVTRVREMHQEADLIVPTDVVERLLVIEKRAVEGESRL